MVSAERLLLLAYLSIVLSVILRNSNNRKLQIEPRAKTAPGPNRPRMNTGVDKTVFLMNASLGTNGQNFTSPDPVTPARVADPQPLSLYAYVRYNPLKPVEPRGTLIDTDALSDKDKILWQKVVDLANTRYDDGDYVNPALHAAYAAIASGPRLFKIEDNPNLGSGTAGQFTITKFNGPNDFSEARIDLNFKIIKGINSTTGGAYDPSFQKYSGLLGGSGFIPRLAETFGHEANHGIFAQRDPAQGTAIQKILNTRDAAFRALPMKGRYPLPPDVLQKMQAADRALVPTERFAEQAEKIINGELRAFQVRSCGNSGRYLSEYRSCGSKRRSTRD
jgi:hypothetical protein